MSDPADVIVPLLLDAAGVAPPADEIAEFVEMYPAIRSGVDALYAVPGLADTAPVLTFSPDA
jgi:hypothetical protein